MQLPTDICACFLYKSMWALQSRNLRLPHKPPRGHSQAASCPPIMNPWHFSLQLSGTALTSPRMRSAHARITRPDTLLFFTVLFYNYVGLGLAFWLITVTWVCAFSRRLVHLFSVGIVDKIILKHLECLHLWPSQPSGGQPPRKHTVPQSCHVQ